MRELGIEIIKIIRIIISEIYKLLFAKRES